MSIRTLISTILLLASGNAAAQNLSLVDARVVKAEPSNNPVLSIADARVLEGNSGTAQLAFRVSLSAPSTGNVSFKLTTADNAASAPSDYTALVGASGTIPAGQTSTTINVVVNGDPTIEINETLFAAIDELVGNVLPGDLQAVGQVLNDDGNILASVPGNLLDINANDTSSGARMTPDGRYVVFHSRATDLSYALDHVQYDVYLRDTVLGTTTLVSRNINGGRGNGESSEPSVSDDGRYVAFVSYANDLVPNDSNNGKADVFRRDMRTGVTQLVTVPANGVGGANDNTFSAVMSGDGNHVAFNSYASNLLANLANGGARIIIVRNMQTGVNTWQSAPYTPALITYPNAVTGISRDGRYIVFNSQSGNFVDVNDGACASYSPDNVTFWPCGRAYWRDTLTGTTQIVNTDSDGVPAYLSSSSAVSISADGRWVGFQSDAFDPYHTLDVFVRDSRDGKTYIASIGPGAQFGNGPSYGGHVSPDGTHVAFTSEASNLVANDTNGKVDAFIRTIGGTSNVRMGVAADGGQANGDTAAFAISNGARYGALVSDATNLVIGDVNGVGDVFVSGNPGVASGDADLASLVPSIGALSPAFAPATTSYTMSVTASSIRFTPVVHQPGSTVTVNGTVVASGKASQSFALSFGANIVTIVVTTADGVTKKTTTVTVTRENASVPLLSIEDAATSEGNSGMKQLNFTVRLSAAAAANVGFNLATTNGTAVAGADYIALQLGSQIISAGTTSKTFAVSIKGDTMLESDETFFVDVSGVSGAAVGDARGQGTIANDEESDGPVLYIRDADFVQEGEFGESREAIFTISLSKPATVPVVFDIATSDLSASVANFNFSGDYQGKTTFGASIPAGSTSTEFRVHIGGDSEDEANERFRVSLSNVSGALLGDGEGVGTIIDNDGPNNPVFSISDASVFEGNSGTKLATFMASISSPTDVPVTFGVYTVDETAHASTDYVATSFPNLVIPAGSTSTTFSVEIMGDTLMEGDESFEIRGNTPLSGVTAAMGSQPRGRILEDDAPRLPKLSVNDVRIAEGNNGHPLAIFTVTLSEPSANPVSFSFTTSDNSAASPTDFTARMLTGLVIPAGRTTKQVSVSLNGDTDVEQEESFVVNVIDVVGATIEDGLAICEIVNDDAVGAEQALSVGDVSIAEGDSGTKTLTVGVDLGIARSVPVFFDIATSNGSATAGSDYVANALMQQEIPAGATHRDFSIIIKGDTVKEPDETILVTLSNVSGTYASDPEAVATIIDEESGGNDVTPELRIADFNVSEGNAGGRPAYLTISLSVPGILPVEFDLDMVNLTATAGSDYQSLSLSRVTIPAGETSKTIALTVYGDTVTEADETFMAVVSSVTGATATDDIAVGKIVNDDGIPIPGLSIADASIIEGHLGNKEMSFTVSLSSPAPSSIYFDIAAVNGTADTFDYQYFPVTGFTIEAGQSSRTFTVDIKGDELAEADEIFTINVLNVAGAAVVDGSAIGTILNDDSTTWPVMSISDGSVTEGNSGIHWLNFTVSLSFPVNGTVGFKIESANGTALADEDYFGFELGDAFAPGETSITYSVPIYGDSTFEFDETFFVKLVRQFVQAAAVDKDTAVCTIVNDDLEDDDSLPALTIGDVLVAEGNSGARIATFYVSLSTPAPNGGVSFNIATSNVSSNGNAATANIDFAAVNSQAMTIPAGQTSASFGVKILGDTSVESNEIFNVSVSNLSGATVAKSEAIGTIINDDNASLQDSNSDTTTSSGITSIAAIQGTDMLSPMVGKQVVVQGVVTAVRQDGFFLQTPDAKRDADQATSDAIFVFTRVPPNRNAARGNLVEVAGQVREVAYHSAQKELSTTSIEAVQVTLVAPGNKLPQPIVLNASMLKSDRASTWLERFESMRVTMPKMLVVAPTTGRINDTTAVSISDGRFYGVAYGTARPFREPGIPAWQMAAHDSVGKVAVFDENPERMHVDSLGQAKSIAMSVDVGDVITGIVGVLAQANDSYSLFTDANAKPPVVPGATPRAVSVPSASEFTIGNYNARRFFDDVDDHAVNEPVLTKGAYALRLAKTANAICNYMHSPDIVGIAEVEKQSTLSDLAEAVNSHAGNVLFPNSCNKNPGYRALMAKGNSASGKLGFLVSTANVRPGIPRVRVLAVVEEGISAEFKRVDGSSEALFERPPLLLRAQLNKAKGESETLMVIVNQLLSTIAIDDSEQASFGWSTRADYIYAKRRAQMQFLASLLAARQSGNARERIVLLGGFESNEFSNGKDDLMGLIAGTSAGLQPMINMTSRMPQQQRYSVIRSGNAQAVDHVLVSKTLLDGRSTLRTEFARINADFGEDNAGDFEVPVRLSDHDPLVLYLGQPEN